MTTLRTVSLQPHLNAAGIGVPLLAYKIFDKTPRRPEANQIIRQKSQSDSPGASFSLLHVNPRQELQQHQEAC